MPNLRKEILKRIFKGVAKSETAEELFKKGEKKLFRLEVDPIELLQGWNKNRSSATSMAWPDVEGLYWAGSKPELDFFAKHSGYWKNFSPEERAFHTVEGSIIPGTKIRKSLEDETHNELVKLIDWGFEKKGKKPIPFWEKEDPAIIHRSWSADESSPSFDEFIQRKPGSVVAKWKDLYRILAIMGLLKGVGEYGDSTTGKQAR